MKTILSLSFLAFVFVSLMCHCNSIGQGDVDSLYMDYDHQKVPYKFYSPTEVFSLDNDLEEISGLSYAGDGQLAAVEDENGKLYLLNEENAEIIRTIKFGKDGDYEGVEVVNGKAFVVKSNGDIYSFNLGKDQDEVDAKEVNTIFSGKNDVEGMGFDGKYILLACKGDGDTEDNDAKGKAVYQYDINKEKVLKKEWFDLDKDDLEKFVKNRKHFNKVRDFDPSAIAIHPVTSDIYLLSGDKILLVLSSNHEIKEAVRLNGTIYRQPEGMCFSPDGTLYIASEGGKLMKLLPIR